MLAGSMAGYAVMMKQQHGAERRMEEAMAESITITCRRDGAVQQPSAPSLLHLLPSLLLTHKILCSYPQHPAASTKIEIAVKERASVSCQTDAPLRQTSVRNKHKPLTPPPLT
jgi:hypothetical protein